jgi:hypothetical protein
MCCAAARARLLVADARQPPGRPLPKRALAPSGGGPRCTTSQRSHRAGRAPAPSAFPHRNDAQPFPRGGAAAVDHGGARLAGHRQPAPAATTPRSRGCGSRRRATTPRPGTRRATCCRNTATRSWTTRARLRAAEIHCCRDLPRKSRSRREDLPPRRPSQRLQGTGDVNDGPALRVLLRPATGTQEEWLQAQKWPTDAEANPCDGEWRSWCVAWV